MMQWKHFGRVSISALELDPLVSPSSIPCILFHVYVPDSRFSENRLNECHRRDPFLGKVSKAADCSRFAGNRYKEELRPMPMHGIRLEIINLKASH